MAHSENINAAKEPCKDCVQARLTAWHGFTHGCLGCVARAVARGPHYRRCRDAGMQDRSYRAELERRRRWISSRR